MKRPLLPTTRVPVVLLVQQSRDDGLEMYTELLRYYGLSVIPVSDARDALTLAPQADIVVTGIRLDDPMDGVELVSRLRHNASTRSTPIVVLTACAWPKERDRAEGAGCDLFLSKPCLPDDLLDKVQQLLTAAGSRRANSPHAFQHPSHTGRGVAMNRGELKGKAAALKGKISRARRKLGEAVEHVGHVMKK